MKSEHKAVATNKKAYHDYFVEETIEAGLELFGTEVKSVRQGKVNLNLRQKERASQSTAPCVGLWRLFHRIETYHSLAKPFYIHLCHIFL